MMASKYGISSTVTGVGKNLFGPMNWTGDARLKTGSVNIRLPSSSMIRLECPSQVIRKVSLGRSFSFLRSAGKGPGVFEGCLLGCFLKSSANILPVLPSPPTLVGIGFRKILPSKCDDGSIVLQYFEIT